MSHVNLPCYAALLIHVINNLTNLGETHDCLCNRKQVHAQILSCFASSMFQRFLLLRQSCFPNARQRRRKNVALSRVSLKKNLIFGLFG